MNTTHHIVMRQIMELEIPSQEAAYNLQHRIGSYCRNVMPELLDQVCSRCDSGDRVFRIDRLEIDLGLSAERLFDQPDKPHQRLGAVVTQVVQPVARTVGRRR